MLRFDNHRVVDCVGRSGGVALLWKNNVKLCVTNHDRNFIDVEIMNANMTKWRLTGFYGFPERARRRESWNLLKWLANKSDLPWVVIGDFNDMISINDKKGRHDHPQALLDGFEWPDGLNPAFYQHFWHLFGKEVFLYCKKCLTDLAFPADLNDTIVVLISKRENANKMKDFRPIALCNVLYKVIAKVLANRLKKKERYGWGGCSETYDRVDWGFLMHQMKQLGFAEKWIAWMQLCVTTVAYSVNLNGNQVGPINPSRGLCQSDPLSPYLFLFCVEDDSFLFSSAKLEEVMEVKAILQKYELQSGQAINLQKLGRSKKIAFYFLKDRLWSKLQSWDAKSLSKAGKTVLLRIVAQSLPSYAMSCFLLPKSLCIELERMMNSYW
ncbi:uncharacterized protein LOC141680854 [Apium graveolens]|uniref:uncharacterized protein LOC141680854 n=1 Tax=Apium graveolens TaxID=4045 RepID=UPI003D790779